MQRAHYQIRTTVRAVELERKIQRTNHYIRRAPGMDLKRAHYPIREIKRVVSMKEKRDAFTTSHVTHRSSCPKRLEERTFTNGRRDSTSASTAQCVATIQFKGVDAEHHASRTHYPSEGALRVDKQESKH